MFDFHHSTQERKTEASREVKLFLNDWRFQKVFDNWGIIIYNELILLMNLISRHLKILIKMLLQKQK